MSSCKRLQVLNSHISGAPQQSSAMASEKDAALAAVASDSPTMYTLPLPLFTHLLVLDDYPHNLLIYIVSSVVVGLYMAFRCNRVPDCMINVLYH